MRRGPWQEKRKIGVNRLLCVCFGEEKETSIVSDSRHKLSTPKDRRGVKSLCEGFHLLFANTNCCNYLLLDLSTMAISRLEASPRS
jgi:hypothetical protein